MFVELFFPKELRKIIQKYREEGTLNEVINKKLRSHIRVSLLVFVIFFWMLSYKLETYWLVILSFLFLLVVQYEIRKVFYGNILPYSQGKKIKVKVLKSGVWGRCGSNYLYAVYQSEDGNKIYCKAGLTEAYRSELGELPEKYNIPEEGQTCYIYQSKMDTSKGMPDIKFFKENYSLTTLIL